MDAEVWMLSPQRSALAAIKFLDAVMPSREPSTDDYPFPQFADDPDVVFTRPEEVIDRLEDCPHETYLLHWENMLPGDPRFAMLFYTEDQGLIVGIVVNENHAVAWLSRLASLIGSQHGYLTSEEVPPETTAEFIERCRVSTVPRIYEGKLAPGEW